MHRKRVKSYNEPGHAHELTFSSRFRRLSLHEPRSQSPRTCWFVDAMKKARRKCHLLLWAYVIMPEHVHVIVWPQEEKYEMRLIRTALKVPVQRQALQFLWRRAPKFLERLEDEQPNGEVHYRFWQRGGGYDRNAVEPGTLGQVIEHIHNNPVRRGLVVESDRSGVWSSLSRCACFNVVPIADPHGSTAEPGWLRDHGRGEFRTFSRCEGGVDCPARGAAKNAASTINSASRRPPHVRFPGFNGSVWRRPLLSFVVMQH